MSFCSFSQEFENTASVTLDSVFLKEYLPEADGNAIRVYLYGLFCCRSNDEISADNFADRLSITKEEVIDAFRYWDEYGLTAIISENPFSVRFLPISKQGKPRKFKPEKYGEFTTAIQALIPERMIGTSEYTAYFNIMEEYAIKPEAMLMICKYCVDLKGANIGFHYIITVARDFASRGIITTELIEQELADYSVRSSDITAILSAMGSKRKPELEDLQLYNKWRKELGYEHDVLLYIAKKSKRKNIHSLDEFILELYSSKLFTKSDVDDYVNKKEEYRTIALKVCRALSVYVEVLEPVVINYISPWLAKGYDSDTLEFLATYCFKKNKRSLEDLDNQVTVLYDKGLVTLTSIAEYAKNGAKTDEFIKAMLLACATPRRPTDSDRETLKNWQNWGFTDEMILEACKLAAGKSRPLVYVNAILSDWKTRGIFTKDKITDTRPTSSTTTTHFASERTYSKEEYSALFDNLEDINF